MAGRKKSQDLTGKHQTQIMARPRAEVAEPQPTRKLTRALCTAEAAEEPLLWLWARGGSTQQAEGTGQVHGMKRRQSDCHLTETLPGLCPWLLGEDLELLGISQRQEYV